MAKGIRNSEETKIEAARRLRAGEDPTALAKEYGVVESTLEDWKKQFKNRKGKRRMTKPKPRITITTTTMKVVPIGVVEELKNELAFWKNYTLKLIREKESQ